MISDEYRDRLATAFTPPQIEALDDLLEMHTRSLVKARDFNELKEIVRDLAESQKRTDTKMGELAEAQTRTDIKMGELAEAQRQTEIQMKDMAASMQRLADGQDEMKRDIRRVSNSLDDFRRQEGSNAQTLGYLLENEAYRHLPAWLKAHRGIEVTGRLIRQQVGEEEINLLVDAKQGDEEILIVGESKSRLNLSDLGTLAGKVEVVEDQYARLNGRRIVPLMITHFASPKALAKSKEEDIIVVQSFEW